MTKPKHTPLQNLTLRWKPRRGGSACRPLPPNPDEIGKILAGLKCEGRVELDGETIGASEYRPGFADDQRVKWIWWLDAGAVRSTAGRRTE